MSRVCDLPAGRGAETHARLGRAPMPGLDLVLVAPGFTDRLLHGHAAARSQVV